MSPATLLTLVRHGATDWSVAGRFAGSTDLPLSEAGRGQVLAGRALITSKKYDRVLVSPLNRALETARLLGYEGFEVDGRLRERDYGDYEGLTTAEIRERVPGWNVWTDEVPEGESGESLVARVDEIVDWARALDGEQLLLVAHAHWIRMFTARWLGLNPAHAGLFRLDTLGITRLGWERENPVMLSWNA